MKKYSIKLGIRNLIGKYPLLFYSIYCLKYQNRSNLINIDTELVIEGFPRSANSFSVTAFRRLQPKQIKIAHHHHVPAQITNAIKLNIPTIVLIRNPLDAVISFKIYNTDISLIQALKTYISFYQSIAIHKNFYVIASFDEIISDLPTIQ
ncbi:MAG: hypothetical protein QNJ32_14710 [Xenococcaceae cyanobacterium MO_167.B27]|nr:hypothetical protein [Xenococcaceae cyanobacterium MO_167.B27]